MDETTHKRYRAYHSNPKRIKGWVLFDMRGDGRIMADALTEADAALLERLLNENEAKSR